MRLYTALKALTLSVIAIWAAAQPAWATTIDTFDFSQTGWTRATTNGNAMISAGAPAPGATLTGSFTGIVEPGGLIELSDLSSFFASFSDTVNPLPVDVALAELTLFSFNTNGGNSSLDVAGLFDFDQVCIGAAASLDSNCTGLFTEFYPAETKGLLFLKGLVVPTYMTPDQPTVTLVSSVTTPPASVAEPASLSLFGAGLIGIALLKRRGNRKRLVAATI